MRLAILVVLLLAGCAIKPKGPDDWTHPTKSLDDYYKDDFACRKEVQATNLQTGQKNHYFYSCLRARGWREK